MTSAKVQENFFNRFASATKKASINVPSLTRSYNFPTLYKNTTCATAIFTCSYENTLSLMQNNYFAPVKITHNKSLIVFSVYEYKEVSGMSPYNEIAIAVPVILKTHINIPLLPLLFLNKYPGLGFHVISMPVTSEENKLRGHYFWGLPKKTQNITIKMQENFLTANAFDSDNKNYLSLKIPTIGKEQFFDAKTNLFSILNDNLKISQSHSVGTFYVNNFFFLQDDAITLSNLSEEANFLRKLNISQKPIHTRFTRNLSASFDLPQN